MGLPMRLLKYAWWMLIFAAMCGAGYLIYRGLNRYSLQQILDSLQSMPAGRIAMAILFAALSYLCLTGFDFLAVRYAGKPLAYRRNALASFTALSLGHNIGFAALSSGAVRYRFYSRWGLSGQEIAKVILFCGVTVGLGLAGLAGIGLVLYPEDAETLTGFGSTAVRTIAALCLLAPLSYIAAAAFSAGASFGYRGWTLEVPAFRLAAAQTGIGIANFAAVAACLHQLFSAFDEVAYVKVAAVYSMANAAALVSHVPGGLGVIEAAVVYLIPGATSLAAVIAFRVIYFFIPLSIGLPLFLTAELWHSRQGASENPAKQS
jgi:glycosyltransferase 2 family protein